MGKCRIEYVYVNGVIVAKCFDDIDIQAEQEGNSIHRRSYHNNRLRLRNDYNSVELDKLFKK